MAMAANPIIAIAGAIALVVTALNSYTKAQKEATAASVSKLDSKAIDNRLKAAEEELAYLDTLEGKRRYSISAQKAMNERLTNEISLLRQRKTALEENTKAEGEAIKQREEIQQTSFVSPTQPQTQGRGQVSGVGGGLESQGLMTPITSAIKADTAGIPAALAEQSQVLSEGQLAFLERAAEFQHQAGQIMTAGMQNVVTGMSGAIGSAITSGGNLMGALGGVIISGIAQIAENLGKAAIKIGLTMKAIKMAFKSPATAIAAGVALIAISKAIQTVIPKIASGEASAFANGGIVSGPTMGLVGEYPGARQNPEVIAPLNKLQSMIGGGGQNINIGGQIRLEGQDLLIAIERANETAGRIY